MTRNMHSYGLCCTTYREDDFCGNGEADPNVREALERSAAGYSPWSGQAARWAAQVNSLVSTFWPIITQIETVAATTAICRSYSYAKV